MKSCIFAISKKKYFILKEPLRKVYMVVELWLPSKNSHILSPAVYECHLFWDEGKA